MSALKRLLGLCVALGLCLPAAAEPARSRALWVWDPTPLLADAGERQQFFEFCRERGIGVAWMQIATTSAGRRARALERAADWRAFLGEAHRAGLAVHALDGDPRYARREQHALVLAIVDAVSR